MDAIIELAIESPGGIIDCRVEPVCDDEGQQYYTATILYPNIVNGFSRSEIYCHNLSRDTKTGQYFFEDAEDIHPKIKKLEAEISKAISRAVAGS